MEVVFIQSIFILVWSPELKFKFCLQGQLEGVVQDLTRTRTFSIHMMLWCMERISGPEITLILVGTDFTLQVFLFFAQLHNNMVSSDSVRLG